MGYSQVYIPGGYSQVYIPGGNLHNNAGNPATESTLAQGILFRTSPVSLLAKKESRLLITRFTVGGQRARPSPMEDHLSDSVGN